jgi:hypothetical protein
MPASWPLIPLVLVGSDLPALPADSALATLMGSPLAFGHQLHGSPGQYVRDLELIAKATEPSDWIGQVEQLPLK